MSPDPLPPPGTPPPVVVQQRREGMGCFGIGCVILLICLLLIGGLCALLAYLSYSKVNALTTATPAKIQTVDAGDSVFQSAEDKMTAFQQAEDQQRPASLELTADEINTMMARNPDLTKNHIQVLVTMSGDRMQIQGTLPTNVIPIPFGILKDQYFSGSADFSPSFDPAAKELKVKLYGLKLGSQDMPVSQLTTLQAQLNPVLNARLRMQPDSQSYMDRLQTVEVRDGKLEIQTR